MFVYILKISGDISVENVIDMLIPSITNRLDNIPATEFNCICSCIYEILVEANVEEMIEETIGDMTNVYMDENSSSDC